MPHPAVLALRLLSRPGSVAADDLPPPAASSLVRWIAPIGVAIGLAWMGVFRATGLIFRDPEFTQVRAVHALAVVAMEALLTGTGLIYGLTHALNRRATSNNHVNNADKRALIPNPQILDPILHSTLIIVLTLLTYWVLIESLPSNLGWYPPRGDRRHFLNPLYPLATVRPLFLAPIWGRWAFLLAAGIGRAAPHADATTRAVCATLRPSVVFRWMLVPLVPTIAYTLRQQRLFGGFLVVLFVLLLTYLAALYFARRHAGQTRETLQGSGAIAQLVFLAAYRALCV